MPELPEISIENIEGVLNKIRPIIAVSGCTIEVVALRSENFRPQVSLRMTGGSTGMQAVKFEIVQRLNKYFSSEIFVVWE